MEEKRLPQNGKEGLLYGSIIAIITVAVMATFNIGMTYGKLDKSILLIVLKAIPLVWIVVMLLESLVVGRIANALVIKFTEPSDCFNAKILFNIFFCVAGMSAIMTILGTILGTGFSMEPFYEFPSHWPRNFFVALWCELLVAQPAARAVMKLIHNKKGTEPNEECVPNEQ